MQQGRGELTPAAITRAVHRRPQRRLGAHALQLRPDRRESIRIGGLEQAALRARCPLHRAQLDARLHEQPERDDVAEDARQREEGGHLRRNRAQHPNARV